MVKVEDIVLVQWLDTSCLNEDIIACDGLRLMPEVVVTYGKIISVSDDILRIVGEENIDKDHHMYRSVSAIPTAIIKSIVKLNKGDELWNLQSKTKPMTRRTKNYETTVATKTT